MNLKPPSPFEWIGRFVLGLTLIAIVIMLITQNIGIWLVFLLIAGALIIPKPVGNNTERRKIDGYGLLTGLLLLAGLTLYWFLN